MAGAGGGATTRPGSAAAAPAELQKVLAVWPALLERLQQGKAATAAYLMEGCPVSFQPGDPSDLVVGFPKGKEFHCQALGQLATRQWLEQILAELLNQKVRCQFQTFEALAPAPEPGRVVAPPLAPATAPSPEKADPAYLNSVLELFEGRVLPGEGS